MVETLRPDVYLQEVVSQVQPIEGVGVNTAGLIVLAEKGPLDQGVLTTSWDDWVRTFGSFYNAPGFGKLQGAYEARGFYENSGQRLITIRVAHRDAQGVSAAVKSSKTILDEQGSPQTSFTLRAKSEGLHGDRLSYTVAHNPRCSTTLAANTQTSDTSISLTSVYGLKPGSEIKIASSGGGTTVYRRVQSVTQGNPGTIVLTAAVGGTFDAGDPVVSEEFNLTIYQSGSLVEGQWRQISMWESYNGVMNEDFIEAKINDPTFGSLFVSAEVNDSNTAIYQRHPAQTTAAVALTGGNDGLANIDDDDFIGDASIPSGLQAMAAFDEVNMVAIPGRTGAAIADALATFVETQRFVRFFHTTPSGSTPATAQSYRLNTPGLTTSRGRLDFPWVEVRDTIGVGKDAKTFVSGEGHRMGARIRLNVNNGIFHGGFGYLAQLRGVTGLQYKTSDGEQDFLHPLDINVTRSKLGRGIGIWGGRTLSLIPEYKMDSVMATLLFLEESISDSLGWVVGEPNTEKLWERVSLSVSTFLLRRWEEGYLQGSTPNEAFYVLVNESNNPPSAQAERRLYVDIGVAIVKPVEFLILRFVQWDGGRLVEELGLSTT